MIVCETEFFGGAVLADASCGVASFTTSAGDVLTFEVHDDPEFTMSGLVDACASFERW